MEHSKLDTRTPYDAAYALTAIDANILTRNRKTDAPQYLRDDIRDYQEITLMADMSRIGPEARNAVVLAHAYQVERCR